MFHPQLNPTPPELDLLCRIKALVSPVVSLGITPTGERRYVPIIGGQVEGREFRGQIVSGGTDWQLLRQDNTLEVNALYVVQLIDGAQVQIHSRGFRHGPHEVMQRMAAGAPVDPDEYYFRTCMTFCTSSSKWAHLNSLLAVGKGTREPDAAILNVYVVG